MGGLSSGGKLTHSSAGQESKPAHRLTLPEGKQFQAGCIIFSDSVCEHEHCYFTNH